jgi:hypothetical protein
MISVQDIFIQQVIQDTNVHGTTFDSNTIDIFNEAGVASKAGIIVAVGTNTDAFTTLKLQGSNTNNGTDWADVDGSVVGTDVDVNGDVSVLPGVSFANKFIYFTINTNSGAYRYYRVVATANSAGTSCHIGVYALLGHRGNVALPQDVATGADTIMCVPPVIPDTH